MMKSSAFVEFRFLLCYHYHNYFRCTSTSIDMILYFQSQLHFTINDSSISLPPSLSFYLIFSLSPPLSHSPRLSPFLHLFTLGRFGVCVCVRKYNKIQCTTVLALLFRLFWSRCVLFLVRTVKYMATVVVATLVCFHMCVHV